MITKDASNLALVPQVLFEDDSILILDKPAGLVVNRSDSTKSGTVQDFVDTYFNYNFTDEDEFSKRSGIAHRLDKDTSGVLVVAKSADAFYVIKDQFKQKKVAKEYIAIVRGVPKEQKFEIDAPIKRDPNYRLRMSIHFEGREATTYFEVIKTAVIADTTVTKLLVRPKTGRMHQIRVHLLALNLPIMCDRIYMTSKELLSAYKVFDRLMLHAYKISFIHPTDEKLVEFESVVPTSFNI